MKTLYRVQIRKSDGSFVEKNIQATDVAGKVAIVIAIEAALEAAGNGSTFWSANVLGQVDLDASASTATAA